MKKILAVFAAVCMLFCVTGCTQDNGVSAETTEIKTIEPPENGWTVEQLNEAIYVNGINYDYPVTLKDLGKDFSADESLIYYKDRLAFGGSVDSGGIYSALYFSANVNESELPDKSLVSVNGVTLETDMQELFSKMGETEQITYKEVTRIIYTAENMNVIFLLNEEMKVNDIVLSWGE